ncbi:MAG: hypothetical protein QN141_05555 [Armatimonadota bacterium]|nr:hypothetical protein [Armatimonadota bacterium]MDR7452678.1 hypothetical protein [Armatimonadota bacterium]MDR7466716.1 hypothetical protein [Armatimonadota bacterium]MDR7492810.1 hypothetical protein [Armatimonadota bacterium]MDR7498586.1 hypothetical protein [Armatimonadota bacterium]
MTPRFLAADLDGRLIVLDLRRARVVLFDRRSADVWRAAEGLTAEEITALVRAPSPVVDAALTELATAELVTATDGRWSRVMVRWV